MVLIAIFIIIIAVFLRRSKIRFNLPHGSLLCIDGAVKVGKTKCAVTIALRDYRKALIRWAMRKILLRKKEEKPLLYSNIPINIKGGYVKVTQEILKREKRVAYGSVVLLSEASLVADNNLYKDREATIAIMLFVKLYGHESKGGTLIVETQAIGDLAVQIRRCLANKWFIDHATKIPLLGFSILHIRNERYSEDGTTSNIYTNKEEFDKLFVSNKVHKKYDSYCYSVFTDSKPCEQKRIEPSTLKAENVVSFSKDVLEELEKEMKTFSNNVKKELEN